MELRKAARLQGIYKKQGLFHLHKIIPFGAGLGGGSSNAAFTLKLLNKYFKLNLNSVELIRTDKVLQATKIRSGSYFSSIP